MPFKKRSVAFSGKAKKQQLKEKKERLKNRYEGSDDLNCRKGEENVVALNRQPVISKGRDPNRYNLNFRSDSNNEIVIGKKEAEKTIVAVAEENLEINIDDFFPPQLTFPVRPPWDFCMSKEELDGREQHYFAEYKKHLEESFDPSELNYYEMNIETWRQLWRVLEMSDILLFVTDVRFPALLFPPSLYTYVTKKLKKHLFVVLNKVDLAPSPLVAAWTDYFKTKYPKIHVLMFTSFPSYNYRSSSVNKGGSSITRRLGKMRMAAEGAQQLLDACQDVVKGRVDLTSWQEKISEEKASQNDVVKEVEVMERINLESQHTHYHRHKLYEGGVLTIGCIGQPNVGKSSLMNALMGKKVVSVSRTPGKTKHFQTIFLTRTVRICDCPGLVFPSKVPKTLKILMGSFPIAQVREPYTCVQFLAERVDLVSSLKISHPEKEEQWSAMDICDAWAKKQGFYTAKTARPDCYRAANHILRMSLDGKVVLCMRPPGYCSSGGSWQFHDYVKRVQKITAVLPDNCETEKENCDKKTGQPAPAYLSDELEELFIWKNKFQVLHDEQIV